MATKATRATLKAFIKNNLDSLLIRKTSSFDAMSDGVESTGVKDFSPAQTTGTQGADDHTYGIEGVWMVLGGRDHITELEVKGMKGFHVFNSCGSFDLAVAC